MSKMRIRYGRKENRKPKNTLATYRDGDVVYFGISRCNTVSGDRFEKTEGAAQAELRANVAHKVSGNLTYESNNGTVTLHRSGLLGYTTVKDIKALLEYFNNVDEIWNPRNQERSLLKNEG